jgi:hypothetical protein
MAVCTDSHQLLAARTRRCRNRDSGVSGRHRRHCLALARVATPLTVEDSHRESRFRMLVEIPKHKDMHTQVNICCLRSLTADRYDGD